MEYASCEEIPIIEIIRKYGNISEGQASDLEAGRNINCPFPFHDDKNPSFAVQKEKNFFKCFGGSDGSAGGPVAFVRLMLGLPNNKEAEKVIKEDFTINEDAVPELETFARMKGLSKNILENLGWDNVPNGIAIPYSGTLPEQRSVTTKIRTKYSGANKYISEGKGIEAMPYGLEHIEAYDKKKTLFITEGETDMVTLYQAGYQSLGIPGAGLYKEKWNKYLLGFNMVVIVMDNDRPGRELVRTIRNFLGEDNAKNLFFIELPKGIKDVNEFHCTTCHKDIDVFKEEFNKLVAIPTTEEGFRGVAETTEILTKEYLEPYVRMFLLDDKYARVKFAKFLREVQGKARGFLLEDIKDIIKDLVKANEETDKALPPDSIIPTKEELEQIMTEPFKEGEEGGYVYARLTKEGVKYERFTNFTIKVLRQVQMADGEVKSEWELTTMDGRRRVVLIGANERSSSTDFLKQLGQATGYYYGPVNTPSFHQRFVFYIEGNTDAPIAMCPERVGRYENVWLFDEFGIDSKGNVVKVSAETNTYNLDGVDYLPPKSQFLNGEYNNTCYMPVPGELTRDKVLRLLELFKQNQGTIACLAMLGWVGATYFKDKIIERKMGFPVCYITGNAQSGKTTLANWLLQGCGFKDKLSGGARSSISGINAVSQIYGNLPLWFDDIRGLGEDGIWNTIILGFYENTADYKATKTRSLSVLHKYNASLLITSEFFMSSPAAASRCCRFVVDSFRQDRAIFMEVDKAMSEVLPYLGVECAVNLQKNQFEVYKEVVRYKKMMEEQGVGGRIGMNYAILLAGFKLLTLKYVAETDEIFKELVEYLVSTVKQEEEEILEHNYAENFLIDVVNMLCGPVYDSKLEYGKAWFFKNNEVYILTKEANLYNLWKEYRKNDGDVKNINEQSFISQLRRLEGNAVKPGGITRMPIKYNRNEPVVEEEDKAEDKEKYRRVSVIGYDLDILGKSKNPTIAGIPERLREKAKEAWEACLEGERKKEVTDEIT